MTEICSPPRVSVQAKKFGLKIGEARDLSTGLDFRLPAHFDAAYRHVREKKKPLVVIGSPPCTPFSQLQTMNPDTEESAQKYDEGVRHMRFMIGLYKKQLEEGRVFLHEHPAGAKSWGLEEVKEMIEN